LVSDSLKTFRKDITQRPSELMETGAAMVVVSGLRLL